MDSTIRLWDVFTGKELGKLKGHLPMGTTLGYHLNYIRHVSLAFAPDGKRLASASGDSTALIWELSRKLPRRASTDKDLRNLWRDLGADAPAAYQALADLVTDPKRAVPFLRTQVRPTAVVAPKRLAALIGRLDADNFEEREKATRTLEQLGEGAVGALKAKLADRPSEEQRKRIEVLLEKVQPATPSSEQARPLRAVQALEIMGTPEARQVLTELAKGVPEARLTRDAKASLDRLEHLTRSP